MLKLNKVSKKNVRADERSLKCNVCGTNRGMIHKYGLNICRRCFREVAAQIGFKKLS